MEDKIRIYVAAASSEYRRAEYWIERLLKDGGFAVTSSWVQEVKISGSNQASISHEQRLKLADDCQAGIENSDIVWILMPEESSMGAFWEFGFAVAYAIATCVSGKNQHASIFTSLAKYNFEEDILAFTFIKNLTMKKLYSDPD